MGSESYTVKEGRPVPPRTSELVEIIGVRLNQGVCWELVSPWGCCVKNVARCEFCEKVFGWWDRAVSRKSVKICLKDGVLWRIEKITPQKTPPWDAARGALLSSCRYGTDTVTETEATAAGQHAHNNRPRCHLWKNWNDCQPSIFCSV